MKLRPPKLLQPIQIVRIANSLLIRVRGVIVLTSISVSYRSLASQDYLALSGPEFLKYRFPSSTLLVLLPRDVGRVLLVFSFAAMLAWKRETLFNSPTQVM